MRLQRNLEFSETDTETGIKLHFDSSFGYPIEVRSFSNPDKKPSK
jgi:hypothetical protein